MIVKQKEQLSDEEKEKNQQKKSYKYRRCGNAHYSSGAYGTSCPFAGGAT